MVILPAVSFEPDRIQEAGWDPLLSINPTQGIICMGYPPSQHMIWFTNHRPRLFKTGQWEALHPNIDQLLSNETRSCLQRKTPPSSTAQQHIGCLGLSRAGRPELDCQIIWNNCELLTSPTSQVSWLKRVLQYVVSLGLHLNWFFRKLKDIFLVVENLHLSFDRTQWLVFSVWIPSSRKDF